MAASRLEWLDVMKGVAILLVVVGHVLNNMQLMHSPVNLWIHQFNMPFFFMLSGFLAWNTNKRSLWTNLKNKARSLLIPFLSCGFLYSFVFQKLDEWIGSLYHAGFWFLISLFTCWLIFLPLAKLIGKLQLNKNIIAEAIILMIPFFLGNQLMKILPADVNEMLSFPLTFAQYRFFILGYIIGKIYAKQYQMGRIEDWIAKLGGQDLCVSYLVFVFFSFCAIAELSFVNHIPKTIVQVLLTTSLFGILYDSRIIMEKHLFAILQHLGVRSLAIYVLHVFFVYQFTLGEVALLAAGFQILIAVLLAIVVILLTLALATPIYKDSHLSYLFLGQIKK